MSENVRVCVRMRPPNIKEKEHSIHTCIRCNEEESIFFKDDKEGEFFFSFDKCFCENSTQAEIFEYLALPIVEGAMNGINGTILTYGQTGAGKTYSFEGPAILSPDEQRKGILPRVAESVFTAIEADKSTILFNVALTMVEIYVEKIRDLLDPSKDNLQIKENKSSGVFIAGATEIQIQSVEQMLEFISGGIGNRAIGETNMNSASSRSHCVFLVTIHQTTTESGSLKTGKLYLVDLAGSEKIEKTGVEGKRLDEAKTINKSLSALGNVINALTAEKPSYVPYRDSKLTRILQNSLGGNSKIALLCCCSPSTSNASETLSTLRFASRAKLIKVKPRVHTERGQDEQESLLNKYAQECKELQAQVDVLNARVQFLENDAGRSTKLCIEAVCNKLLEKLKQSPSQRTYAFEVIDMLSELFGDEGRLSEEPEYLGLEEAVEAAEKCMDMSLQELHRNMELLKKENEALKTELRAVGYLHPKPLPGKLLVFHPHKSREPISLPRERPKESHWLYDQAVLRPLLQISDRLSSLIERNG